MEDRGKGRGGMKGRRTYLYVDECGTERGVGFKRGLVYIFKDNTHFPIRVSFYKYDYFTNNFKFRNFPIIFLFFIFSPR